MTARALAALSSALLLGAAAAANGEMECHQAYTDAYMSTLNGACQATGCTPECQAKIDAVSDGCKGVVYSSQDDVTGLNITRSFIQKAVLSLEVTGPVDCDYSVGYPHCDSSCTMANVTGGTETSDLEMHECIAVDPVSGQSQPNAIWHSCEGVCKTKFQNLTDRCSGCTDPTFVNFLRNAGTKLIDCAIGNGHSCAGLGPALNTGCCAGGDGKVGTADDTCNIDNGTMPITCHTNPSCSAAVQNGATVCPGNFTSDANLLGLFEDCGGDLSQILAVQPHSTQVAVYCNNLGGGAQFRTAAPSQLIQLPRKVQDVAQRSLRHRQLQGGGLPPPSNPACDSAYQAVFDSTVNGSCDATHVQCTRDCQMKITSMLTVCKNSSYTLSINGVNVTAPFSETAVQSLQLLGPPGCAYHLGYESCSADICNIANMTEALGDCAHFFMGAMYLGWQGCTKLDHTKQTPDKIKQCFDKYAKISQQCTGCHDQYQGAPKWTLLQIAADAANKTCVDQCQKPQEIADNINQLCCAGPDGILDTPDDPCHKQCEDTTTAAGKCKSTLWRVPETCPKDSVCRRYVQSLAMDACPSTFLGTVGRGIFYTCGGSIPDLVAKGKPCDANAFSMALSGYNSIWGSGLPAHADWGSCKSNTSKPHLLSGQYCELTCSTGYCVTGNQPRCLDGKVTVASRESPNPMSCQVEPVSSCQFPPNGGCDALTRCTEASFFGSTIVHCGDCPTGYVGTGKDGCHDIDECENFNGFCDENVQCLNFDGGYNCTACPAGMHGDSFRTGGCCPEDKIMKAVGQHGADCVNPPSPAHSNFEKALTLGTNKSSMGFLVVLMLMGIVALVVAAICHLCSKKQYKGGAENGRFTKVDVGSISTAPSIYDSTWAR